jgi:hypothetical protein
MTTIGIYSQNEFTFQDLGANWTTLTSTAQGHSTFTSDEANTFVRLSGIETPTLDNDAVNKIYVDERVGSIITWKTAVVAATTANIAVFPPTDGITTVTTLDGVTLVVGDRVLIKDQTTTTDNGIYLVTATTWVRTEDAAVALSATGNVLWVSSGTTQGETALVVATVGAVYGSGTFSWTAFGAAAAGLAGDVQFRATSGSTLDAATLSKYTFTDSATAPVLEIGVENGTYFIQGIDSVVNGNVGSAVSIFGGGGQVANGGKIQIQGGHGDTTGKGGNVDIIAGLSGTTSGNGGDLNFSTPTSNNGASGFMDFVTGNCSRFETGYFNVTTGDGSANVDGINDAGSGDINLFTGLATGSKRAGSIVLVTGNSGVAGNTPSSGPAGDIDCQTGAGGVDASGTGRGGDFIILTGIGGLTSGRAGNINFTLGSATSSTENGIMTISGGNNATAQATGVFQVLQGGASIAGDVYGLSFNATSDIKFKKDIVPIDNSLSKLMKICGYTYDWKDETKRNSEGKKEFGVIAQQLESVGLGEMVRGDDVNGKSVNYNSLIPLIIEAIKELANITTD